MGVILLLLGIALVLLAFLDALWSTLWVDGNAGPLSSRITAWSWRGVLGLVGRRRHVLLSVFGPFMLMLIVMR